MSKSPKQREQVGPIPREKQLQLIVKRLQVRAPANATRGGVTFAAVAREAKVSTALIHNHYPRVADLIREVQGRSNRQQRDTKHEELVAEREKTKGLRDELESMRQKLRALASINETLVAENEALRSRGPGAKVAALPSRTPPNR